MPQPRCSNASTPTTLIWGRHDRATPLAVAEAARQQYGWRLEVIDGAADDPTLEQPEAFLGALRKAIASIEPQSDRSKCDVSEKDVHGIDGLDAGCVEDGCRTRARGA